MSTNANFTWTPQAGITAQEVWYGRLTDVGSTLPPGVGWAQGTNLYSATANSATLSTLDENTNYRFLVKSHCTTGGSSWSEIDRYKILCPSISTVSHTTALDVTLSIINVVEFAKIVSGITLSIVDPTTTTIVGTTNYTSVQLAGILNFTFGSLTASKLYNIVLTYTIGIQTTTCTTITAATSSIPVCAALLFNAASITPTGFTIIPQGLNTGDTWDLSLDGGVTYLFTAIPATTTSQVVTGLTQSTTYQVVVRRNCAGGGVGVSTAQAVITPAATIAGTISMNSSQNVSGLFTNSDLSLIFNFPTPTAFPITLYFGFTFEASCSGCPGNVCYSSNGYTIFTPLAGRANGLCAGATSGNNLYGNNTPSSPFIVTIPQGVTSFNTGTALYTTTSTVPHNASFDKAWYNPGTGTLGARGYVDLFVKAVAPSGYSAAFTIAQGANITAPTLHNV